MYRIRVENIGAVMATLDLFGKRASDLKAAWDKIGAKVKSDALVLVPKDSGALAQSIKSKTGKQKAIVRAGGQSRRSHGGGVYAPIAHFGTYTHRSKGPRPFLYQAANKNADYATDTVENEIKRLILRMGLND